MKNGLIIVLVILIFVGVGGGFFVGMKYQQRQVPTAGQFGTRAGRFGGAGATSGQNSMRPIAGQILSADSASITVKLADGSSKIVLISDKTTINKTSPAAMTDLKVGENVAAFGTANSDGSVTAQTISLNPTLRTGQ